MAERIAVELLMTFRINLYFPISLIIVLLLLLPLLSFPQETTDPDESLRENEGETTEDQVLSEEEGQGSEELSLGEDGLSDEEEQLQMWQQIFDRIPLDLIKQLADAYNITYMEDITKEELILLILDNATFSISPPAESIDWRELNIRTTSRYQEAGYGQPLTAASGEAYEVYVDKISFVFEPDELGAYKIIAFGHCRIVYEERTLYADVIVANLVQTEEGNTTVDEIMGYGDIMYDQPGQRILGSSFFFYPENLQGVVYGATTYSEPFYVYGSRVSLVDAGRFIIHDGIASTCNLPNPHYLVYISRAWLFDDELIVGTNATFEMGHSKLFYFPFIFQTYFGTGLTSVLGVERGVGFYLHNTLGFDFEDMDLDLMFDYYQKLGIYAGSDFSYRGESTSFTLDLGGAYSRSVKYEADHADQNRFTNYAFWSTEVPEGTSRSEHTTPRYSLDTSLSQDFLSGENAAGISAGMDMDFRIVSDPSFTSQFEGRRYTEFDLQKLVQTPAEESSTGIASVNTSGGGEAYSFGFSASASTSGFSFSFAGDWSWAFKPTSDPLANYKDLDYWHYRRSSFSFPKITFSYSGTAIEWIDLFFGEEEEEDAEEEETEEEEEEEEETDTSIFSALTEETGATDITQTLFGVTADEIIQSMEVTTAEEVETGQFNISLPLSYGFGFNFSRNETYDEDDVLEQSKMTTTLRGNAGQSLSISYKFLSFSSGFNYSMSDTRNKTELADETETTNDDKTSYTSWSGSWSNSLSFTFLEEYEYLEVKLSASFSYSLSDRFDSVIIELPDDTDSTTYTNQQATFTNISGRSRSWSTSFSFSFLKTSFSFGGFGRTVYLSPSEEIDTIIGLETIDDIYFEQRKPLSITISTQLVPNMTISESYSEKRNIEGGTNGPFGGQPASNRINMSYSIPAKLALVKELIFDTISMSFAWTHNYESWQSSNLSFSLNMNFTLFTTWVITLSTQVVNSDLYLYSSKLAKKYGGTHKNIFTDLLKSFNIFNIDHLQETSFKNQGISFSLTHNLHDWDLHVSVGISPITELGITYFRPTFSMRVVLRELPSVEAKRIELHYTRR